MTRSPKFTDETKHAVIADYRHNPGLTVKYLADKHNCSFMSVINWLKPIKGKGFNLRTEIFDRVVELFDTDPNLTQKEMGAILNVSGTTIHKVLTKHFADRRKIKPVDARSI